MSIDLGIIQVTSNLKETHPRCILMKEKVIPSCISASNKNYVLVSPLKPAMQSFVEESGGVFSVYEGWDVDKMRKFRQGLEYMKAEWVGIFDDDIVLDVNWKTEMEEFLKDKPPGQYGFRLTNEDNQRHQFGEDWMQFANQKRRLVHRPLNYDIQTGYVEDSPTAYVANSIVHKNVLAKIEPFGLFGKAPDVMWSFAIRQCGFPIGFNPKARAYHVGNRKDHR